ncbi:RecB-like helicase [Campylobacter sp. 19-13652]|uniref:RecB-like helicase n=1 Tax=Campylobacter sp. 19-13652 TaxID=2840180 RepID=UPI001C777BAF|nr:RecB-like helicase [Campylobacter sp. 19-13652]BCX80088.1 DNA helicase [Campylobacter sp. 19-13652]
MQPYLSLSASAGSGKTFALSVRFIALFLKGADISTITALTFTKKAASEMSERIIDTFLNLHKKQAELDEISSMLNISADKTLQRRDELREEFLSARLKVTTFDSFFATIARSFASYLGISPNFSISDDIIRLSKEAFLAQLDSELMRSLAYYIVAGDKSRGDFFKTICLLYENGVDLSGFNNAPFSVLEADLERAKDRANSALFDIFDFISMKDFAINDAINAFKFNNIDEFLKAKFKLLERDTLEYKTFARFFKNGSGVLLDIKFKTLKDDIFSYLLCLERYKIAQLSVFLELYKNIRQTLNKRLNILNFADVTLSVLELLRGTKSPLYQSGSFDPAQLYFRLDASINHLLIDEFQDTNVAQYEIMLPLIREIAAGAGQGGVGSFFYVGDIKQSIYRFRGGKKELFEKLKQDVGGALVSSSLDTNYRSAAGLVDFVNETFLPVIDDYRVQKSKSDEEGFLNIISSSKEAMIDEAVKITKELLNNGVDAAQVAVLCWKNDDVETVYDRLSEEGIDARKEGVLKLGKTPYVYGLIAYAAYCIFGDEIYLFKARRFLALDDKKILPRLKLDSDKSGAESLIYLSKRAGINLSDENILQACEIGASLDLAGLIFMLDSESLTAPNSDKSAASGVQIMTVHKSKGLEFEHVILLDSVSGGAKDSAEFIYEYEAGGWHIRLRNGAFKYLDESYEKLTNLSQMLDKEEGFNKLYVAFTRAKNSLFIIKNAISDGRSASFFTKTKNGDVSFLDLEDRLSGEFKFNSKKAQQTRKNSSIKLAYVRADEAGTNKQEIGHDTQAINFGLALHYLLELCPSFDEKGLKIGFNAMKSEYAKLLEASVLSDIKTRAEALINHDKFKELLNGAKASKEQDIIALNKQRRLDLLLVKNDELIVIDYKSSRQNESDNLAQLREYLDMLKSIYPQKRIRGVLFYLLANGVESLDVES